MSRGTDQRIELELAVFALTQPMAAPVAVQAAPVQAAPQPFAAAAPAYPAPPPAFTAPPPAAAAPVNVPPPEPEPPQVSRPVQPAAAPARKTAGPVQPFVQWPIVLAEIENQDPMLISFLRGSRAYYDGVRVLIECSDAFRDYMRQNKETAKSIKDYIYKVTKIKCGIGPYQAPKTDGGASAVSVDETLQAMQSLGVDVVVTEK